MKRIATVKEISAVTMDCYVVEAIGPRLEVRQRFGWNNRSYFNENSIADAVCYALDEVRHSKLLISQRAHASSPSRFFRKSEPELPKEVIEIDVLINTIKKVGMTADLHARVKKFISLRLMSDDEQYEINMPLIRWDPHKHYFMLKETESGVEIRPVRVSIDGVSTDHRNMKVELRYLVWDFNNNDYQYRYIEEHPLGLKHHVTYSRGAETEREESVIFYADRSDAEVEARRVLNRRKQALQKQLNELKVA